MSDQPKLSSAQVMFAVFLALLVPAASGILGVNWALSENSANMRNMRTTAEEMQEDFDSLYKKVDSISDILIADARQEVFLEQLGKRVDYLEQQTRDRYTAAQADKDNAAQDLRIERILEQLD